MQAQILKMKVGFVMDVARKDERFLNDLSRDPVRTLQESGIDLAPGEILAVVDVVKDSSHSTHAPLLQEHRDQWKAIGEDASRGR